MSEQSGAAPDDQSSDDQSNDDQEPMDEGAVRRALQKVLSVQARSVIEMSLLAGALTGVAGLAVKSSLREYAAAELADTTLLAEKLVAVGGKARVEPCEAVVSGTAEEALGQLLDHEREGIAALHAVIPHTGQQPRSEALEHLLEHVIMRKQQQVDTLALALDRRDD